MGWIHTVMDLFLHLDKHLDSAAHHMGHKLYLLLFTIVFCETGLVVTPFLPGDSLLFALGALAAAGTAVNLPLTIVLLCVAANCGDTVNYFLGYRVGPKLFSKPNSLLLNRRHLDEAQRFYDRHGRATIIMARFVPIIRTFAPFVAGIGRMPFARFIAFSISGGVLWVVSLSLAGYFFGSMPIVKKNFEIVILAIIVISVIPAAIQALRARRESKQRGLEPIPNEATRE
ncbi:MAG TPA: DedA family protein [Tepidisphaeraceae bacterium]|jgi:membrane-associated protein|nr:DedA family protein [Tepidisphaeraceae bacterium]